MPSLGRAGGVAAVAALLIALVPACAPSRPTTTAFQGFAGCPVGAASAIAFLQRTLDRVGDAEPEDLVELLPAFDRDIRSMLQRAQEVHCTQDGFNAAVIDRIDELVAGGSAGVQLIEVIRERGLGTLEGDGPIRLPSD